MGQAAQPFMPEDQFADTMRAPIVETKEGATEDKEALANASREQAEQVLLAEQAEKAVAEQASEGHAQVNPLAEGGEITDDEFDGVFSGLS